MVPAQVLETRIGTQGSILQIKAGKIRPAQPFPSHQRVVRARRGTARDLDYEDMEEINPGPDPEIAQAVTNIPLADAHADVEMQDI